VFGVVAVYQAMLPLLRESPDARIVNVSSGVGSLTTNADPAYPYHAYFDPIYPASKTALIFIEKEQKVDASSQVVDSHAKPVGDNAGIGRPSDLADTALDPRHRGRVNAQHCRYLMLLQAQLSPDSPQAASDAVRRHQCPRRSISALSASSRRAFRTPSGEVGVKAGESAGTAVMRFAEELRAWRQVRGWSQAELGAKLGYSGSHVSSVERMERVAVAEFAAACDEALQTPGTFARIHADIAREAYPPWFSPFVHFEASATRVHNWDARSFTGLLSARATRVR
jgi:transcriptional regulator with XRE-family HTH domain